MITIDSLHLDIVKDILKKHVPKARVLVFGSRVTGKVKPYSDLDLAVDAGVPLTISQLGELKEAFSESDLPMRVDVVDLRSITPAFHKIIESKYEVVQKGEGSTTR